MIRGTFDWNVGNWNLKMLNDYKKLIATRKENKDAFVYGAFEEAASNKSNKYIVYSRYGNNNRALVVLNNSGSNSTQAITVDRLERYGFKDGDVLKDVMTGNTVTVSNEKAILTSKDMTAAVYVLSSKVPNVSEVASSTNIGLTDENDGRTKLSTVENSKITSCTNGVSLAWDDYKDKDKASDIIVRAFDGNKVIKEIKVAATEKNATLSDITLDDISSGKYTISIKAEANRGLSDSTVNDIYMDSDYVSAGEDTTAPKIVGVTPNDNAVDIDKTSNIVFNFNENIILADNGKISVMDNAGNGVGFEATVSGTQLIINPNEDLKEGISYTVKISEGAVKDEANNLLATQIIVNFKTHEEKEQDTASPEIVTTTPVSSSDNIEINSNIVFNFNKNIVLADKSKISVADDAGNVVAFTETVLGNQLIVNPDEDLKEGISYKVTVAAGTVKDQMNNLLQSETTVIFKTKQSDNNSSNNESGNGSSNSSGNSSSNNSAENSSSGENDNSVNNIDSNSNQNNNNGNWIFKDQNWYHLNESGDMQIGWKQVNGKWYYLDNSGEMAKNTVVDGWDLNSNGEGSEIA